MHRRPGSLPEAIPLLVDELLDAHGELPAEALHLVLGVHHAADLAQGLGMFILPDSRGSAGLVRELRARLPGGWVCLYSPPAEGVRVCHETELCRERDPRGPAMLPTGVRREITPPNCCLGGWVE